MSGLGLTFLRRGNLAHPTAGSDYILSETRGDAEVLRILMSKGVSADGVGITKDDAAKVTNIGTWFQNSAITNFDEFQYFIAVTSLNAQAFRGCTSLRSIKMPDSITSVGAVDQGQTYGALSGCTSLEEVVLSKNLKNLPNAMFASDRSLKYINLENVEVTGNGIYGGVFASAFASDAIVAMPSLKTLGRTVFQRAKMKAVYSLGSVTTMGTDGDVNFGGLGTFYECPNLEVMNLPPTLTRIPAQCFRNNGKLSILISQAVTPPTYGSQCLYGTASSLIIYVPNDAIAAYKEASGWSSYSSKIKGISDLSTDNPTLYNEIKQYII